MNIILFNLRNEPVEIDIPKNTKTSDFLSDICAEEIRSRLVFPTDRGMDEIYIGPEIREKYLKNGAYTVTPHNEKSIKRYQKKHTLIGNLLFKAEKRLNQNRLYNSITRRVRNYQKIFKERAQAV